MSLGMLQAGAEKGTGHARRSFPAAGHQGRMYQGRDSVEEAPFCLGQLLFVAQEGVWLGALTRKSM